MQTHSEDQPAAQWDALIASIPGAHLLQTWEWGQVKKHFGWEPQTKTWYHTDGSLAAAALILGRTVAIPGLPARLRVLYVPKGPLLCDWEQVGLRRQVLDDLRQLALTQGAIFIKIDPDVCLGTGIPGGLQDSVDALGESVCRDLLSFGWRFSSEQVQFRNTVLVDLQPAPEVILEQMKQKTRYNIRLAERKGVTIRPASLDDLELLYQMYAETAVRDGFVIREREYYLTVWKIFLQAGMVEPLIAEVENQPVAGVVVFRFAGQAYYMHGMSRPIHREKMPNYLLQWEAMLRARQAGCTVYDLWGAPDEFQPGDALWGVYRFKEGLGGKLVRFIGAWDLPVRPFYFKVYMDFLPRLLEIMRSRRRRETRQETDQISGQMSME
jgi:lipid II:glycine glycyltransferase (peptidoglycan interpeptide bridge formation enzyme)